jgi:hypothetical protein
MTAAKIPPATSAAGGPNAKLPPPKQTTPRNDDADHEPVANEVAEQVKRDSLLRSIHRQSIIIAVLSVILIVGLPFFRPVFEYSAMDTKNRKKPLIALIMPNMTNKAILSWSTTAITEIMTMGFGDYVPHLKQQKLRFTPPGWESFSRAFDEEQIGAQFKKSQLVLTTVPCNSAVITKQGENEKHIYEWTVQMPVIMTYATNNNKTTHKNAVIELTIAREPSSISPAGIAIDGWQVAHNASVSELCH